MACSASCRSGTGCGTTRGRGRDPREGGSPGAEEFWATTLPDKLAEAARVCPKRFDALFVDEAQDFHLVVLCERGVEARFGTP